MHYLVYSVSYFACILITTRTNQVVCDTESSTLLGAWQLVFRIVIDLRLFALTLVIL